MPDEHFPIHANQSVRLATSSGVSVREDTAYANAKGDEKGGIRKRTEKSIEKLQEPLRKVLEQGETIFCAARVQLPVSPLEQFFLGWMATATDQGVLLLTNRRLLFFLVARNGSWKRSVRSVSLGDIEKAEVKTWLGAKIEIQYRNGRKESYWRLRGDDAKRIKVIMALLLEAGGSERSTAEGRVHLCPQCYTILSPGNYQCTKCSLEFKTEKTMVRRGLLFPGAAYYYAGHSGLAVLDFVIEAFILIEVLVWGAVALGLTQVEPDPGETPITGGAAWVIVVVFVAILAVKKLLIIRHCRRFIQEFVPAK